MKSIFEEVTRNELLSRINTLNEQHSAQWGKMNSLQMLRHCILWDEWVLGKHQPTYKRVFIGLLFGRIALKGVLGNDKPLRHNTPTLPEFIIVDKTGNIAEEKKTWQTLIETYAQFSNPRFVHAFFGKMTIDQIGQMAYKHADHHLRQFNC